MKVKILRFPDGRTAVSTGLQVEINKLKPILESEFDTDESEIREMMEQPHKQAMRMNKGKIRRIRDNSPKRK